MLPRLSLVPSRYTRFKACFPRCMCGEMGVVSRSDTTIIYAHTPPHLPRTLCLPDTSPILDFSSASLCPLVSEDFDNTTTATAHLSRYLLTDPAADATRPTSIACGPPVRRVAKTRGFQARRLQHPQAVNMRFNVHFCLRLPTPSTSHFLPCAPRLVHRLLRMQSAHTTAVSGLRRGGAQGCQRSFSFRTRTPFKTPAPLVPSPSHIAGTPALPSPIHSADTPLPPLIWLSPPLHKQRQFPHLLPNSPHHPYLYRAVRLARAPRHFEVKGQVAQAIKCAERLRVDRSASYIYNNNASRDSYASSYISGSIGGTVRLYDDADIDDAMLVMPIGMAAPTGGLRSGRGAVAQRMRQATA
ncbi:hypothetical protein R3P38DRAFT_3175542 [Favolaschia claudopus]|uniref:Uncharacterized protein n=1 Tax=Favolaschia claudopus TaxID=2862362 RepID=A0AAW0D156_9AGAR